MPTIKLESLEGEVYETDRQITKFSGTIKAMIEYKEEEEKEEEDDDDDDDDEEEAIVCLQVNSEILRYILQWTHHHKDDDESVNLSTDDISPWDADFLKVDKDTLFRIILAAKYLEIDGLLNIACKAVANMIKGKSPEEIQKIFNIINDYTPAEEEM